ncbi:hypothetical protein ACJJTC_011821, partial [Scirpophaga incertulas]
MNLAGTTCQKKTRYDTCFTTKASMHACPDGWFCPNPSRDKGQAVGRIPGYRAQPVWTGSGARYRFRDFYGWLEQVPNLLSTNPELRDGGARNPEFFAFYFYKSEITDLLSLGLFFLPESLDSRLALGYRFFVLKFSFLWYNKTGGVSRQIPRYCREKDGNAGVFLCCVCFVFPPCIFQSVATCPQVTSTLAIRYSGPCYAIPFPLHGAACTKSVMDGPFAVPGFFTVHTLCLLSSFLAIALCLCVRSTTVATFFLFLCAVA